uniref:Nucleotidyltransferase n=1 Tax=candidate division WOR-3 bacterium TaxID=2052148 RepID=A0A7V3ZSY7_UNCW3
MKNKIIKKLKKHLPEIKSRFKVKEIGVFGSRIKGKAKKSSDIDILVEFEKGNKTFDNYMELKFYLENLFGCKVDLVLKSALKEELKQYILSEVIYV